MTLPVAALESLPSDSIDSASGTGGPLAHYSRLWLTAEQHSLGIFQEAQWLVGAITEQTHHKVVKDRFEDLLRRFNLAKIVGTVVQSYNITAQVLDFFVNEVCFDLLLPSADLMPVCECPSTDACQSMEVCKHSESQVFAAIDIRTDPFAYVARASSLYAQECAPALRRFGKQWHSILSSFLVILLPDSEVQVLATVYECAEQVAWAANRILESFGVPSRIQFVSNVDASVTPPSGRVSSDDGSFLGQLEVRLLVEVDFLMDHGCTLLQHLLAQILPLLSEKMLQEWRLIARQSAGGLCECVNAILCAFAEDIVSPFAEFSLQLVPLGRVTAAESVQRSESESSDEVAATSESASESCERDACHSHGANVDRGIEN